MHEHETTKIILSQIKRSLKFARDLESLVREDILCL